MRLSPAVTKEDPWDGHVGRDETFMAKLKAAAPDSEVKDLDPHYRNRL